MPGLIDSLPAGTLHLIAGYAALLVVPGPSTLVVATAGLSSPGRGSAAACGVASGTGVLVVAAAHVWGAVGMPMSLRIAAPFLFAMTLLCIGQRLLAQAVRPQSSPFDSTCPSRGVGFRVGFLTALTNPIGIAFFSTAVLSVPLADDAITAVSACVFVMGLCWFSMVGRLASLAAGWPLPRHAAPLVQGLSGSALVVLATWTVLDALTTWGLV